MSLNPALSVRNIEVVYHHTVQVLRGLSLEVPQGQIVALLGANGAGKTTALKAISGLLPLENGELRAGSVKYCAQGTSQIALARMPPHQIARAGVAHVREGRQIFIDLTVEENLIASTQALSTRGGARIADFDVIYAYFPRLAERRKQLAGYLSGGEQQMLAIGRALIGQPHLMLLDEPSLGLAPKVVDEIFAIIARINREKNVAILLVEQNAFAAFGIAHYAYIMEQGKVVVDGTVDKLRRDPDVQRFYLGYAEGSDAVSSFRDVKHYKRRKRWLS
jgi:branched-chain amino acid transport system ATP-binding protein